MITNFKLFEMNEYKPEVGDYVICSGEFSSNKNFITTHIGKIRRIDSWQYKIEYKYSKDDYLCNSQCILYWSNNKEELELILNTNKFNI